MVKKPKTTGLFYQKVFPFSISDFSLLSRSKFLISIQGSALVHYIGLFITTTRTKTINLIMESFGPGDRTLGEILMKRKGH
jgi:hypothetical protein